MDAPRVRAVGTGMLRLAHRGDWRRAPENTIPAFLAALEIPGCDGLELDVQLSADGVPVVIHDETLARVQRRPGRVDALDARMLEDAGVPTLEAVLSAVPADTFLDIELKGPHHGDATAAVMRAARGDEGRRAVVSSFDAPALVAAAGLLPGWARWLNAEDLGAGATTRAAELGCAGISVLWGAITPASMRRAREAGLVVAAWPVRRVATRDRLERLGVVAACVEGEALD